MHRVLLVVALCVATAWGQGYNAAVNGDYGYWIQPMTENNTLYTLQRPAIATPFAIYNTPFTVFARINPTYNMTPEGNSSFGGGLATVVPRKVALPWPYCMTSPWRVIGPTSQDAVVNSIPGIYGFDANDVGGSITIGLFDYFVTYPQCAGGELVYGEDTIDFGARSRDCSGLLGPRCNETNTRTASTCSAATCRDPSSLTGEAYALLSQSETQLSELGDISALDVGAPSRFKGVITYLVPDTCPYPLTFGIDGSSYDKDVAPIKVFQEGDRSAVFIQPSPSCGVGTRVTNSEIYDPAVRAIPMCDQYVPVLPDNVVNRTVANATERAEWRRLHGFSGTESGPDNLRGFGRRVFMIVADALPSPVTVRIRVTWVGSDIHGFPNVTQPDVYVGFQRTVYVASPPWNDGFAYGLELTWFDSTEIVSRRGRQAFYPGIQRGNLPACVCNSSTVQGNLVCSNGTQLDLSGNGLTRSQISLIYNTAGTSQSIRNTVLCGIVYGSYGTGFLSVASGVTFWAAGVGSSSSFGPVSYTWSLLDVPTAGGQLFSSTGFNVTGVVTSISTFRLRVTVVDPFLFSTTCIVTVKPISALPIPKLIPTEATILPGTFLLLDASGSSTPAGDGLTFAWSIIFPPTSAGVLTGNINSGALQFSSPVEGKFVVQVIVSNSYGDKSALAYITVSNTTSSGAPGSGNLPPSYGGDNGCFAQLPPVSFTYPPGNELPPFSGGGGGSPSAPPPPSVPAPPVAAPEAQPLLPGIPDEAFLAVVVVAVVLVGILAAITLAPLCRRGKRRTE